MDFTIFDTGDPKSPGSGEPKSTDKAPVGKAPEKAAAGAGPRAQPGRTAQGDRNRSLPTRPGVNDSAWPEPARPRFPRGYLLTVCTLVIENEDASSSRILANLFRALYQDETAFNFAALNQLGALNREHAEKLIAAKLAGAYTPVEWERAFRLIEEYADPYLPAAAANPDVSPETGYLDDALAGLREQYVAAPPAPVPSSKPLQRPQQHAEGQADRSIPRPNVDRERAQPRQQIEKTTAVPTAPSVKIEPPRAQYAQTERPRSIRQAPLAEPTRPPERAHPVERPTQHHSQQAPRKGQAPIQRTEPRQHFALTDPPAGFAGTAPPPQFSVRQDRDVGDNRDDRSPANFTVPPDSFRQPGNADSGALRREPIINLDMPLQPDRQAEGEPERGGHDGLMYGLLALIIIAALAFVAINYSLFYKGGIPGFGKSAGVSRLPDKPAEVSRLPDSQARKVSASAAALNEPIDLMPVSQKPAIAPPRWMAFSAPREKKQGLSEPPVTATDADRLALQGGSSPALPTAVDERFAPVFAAPAAIRTATESESARPQGKVEASKPPPTVQPSQARANATRAAAASPIRKAALSDPSASRQAVPAADQPEDRAYLTFAVSPWGEVYVNGRSQGVTPPLRRLEIEPGKHTVEIRNGNLTPYRTVVELEPQATVNIRQQFR